MGNRLRGKIAIVTGAARGLGEAHARRMVAEGAKVVLTDVLDQEGELTAKALGPNALFLHHDVTKRAEWQAIIVETEKVFGPVSVLVNNAGIGTYFPLEELEEAEYRRIVDVNQVSVFLGMKAVLPSMKLAGGGSIINISSMSGLVGNAGLLAYNASKFAVRGMTKSAAIELAPYNIRVNSVHPGFIRTPAISGAPEAAQSAFISAAPLRRIGEPDEVANVVVMLASDESCFSTGAEFVVDGGATCQ